MRWSSSVGDRLVNELGLEPGPELQELQRRILEHDPTLGAPRRLAPLSGSRGGRSLAVAALAAVAALVAVGLVLTGGATGRPPRLAPGASGIVGVDGASDRLVDATALMGVPGSVAAAGGSLWVADPVAERVYQVDPGSGLALDRIPVGAEPGASSAATGRSGMSAQSPRP